MKNSYPMFLYEAPEDKGAGTPETELETPASETPVYSGPSQEEWQQAQETIKSLTGIVPTVQQIAQLLQQPEEIEDETDFDIEAYVQREIQKSLSPIIPVVTTAAQRTGEERMKSIFAQQKKELGDFDEKLAERAAHSFFAETGDPQKAVLEGAKYAAEVRKAEREAGKDEYKASLKRGSHNPDLPVEGGGDRTIPKAKSYDEVIERYAGTDEL